MRGILLGEYINPDRKLQTQNRFQIIPKYALENEHCSTQMYNFYEREKMPTIIKFLLACLLCIGIATAIVYAVKWLW